VGEDPIRPPSPVSLLCQHKHPIELREAVPSACPDDGHTQAVPGHLRPLLQAVQDAGHGRSESFQAGHAGSIPVTRSIAMRLSPAVMRVGLVVWVAYGITCGITDHLDRRFAGVPGHGW
jgi:hypothetical protein